MTVGSGYDLAELRRRVDNIVTLGVVDQVDAANALARVAVGTRSTGWRPWLTRRAGGDRDWWAPEPGEQVVVLSPSGDPEQAVILPALYSAGRPAPEGSADIRATVHDDGARDSYDRAAHLRLIDVPDGGAMTIRCAGVSLTLDASGLRLVGAMDASVDVTAQGVSLVTHVHEGVTPGSGLSGEPFKE